MLTHYVWCLSPFRAQIADSVRNACLAQKLKLR